MTLTKTLLFSMCRMSINNCNDRGWFRLSPVVERENMAFDIKLYQNTAENHRVDKTDYLTLVGTISGTLREETSVTEPVITISYTVFPKVNYAYIEEFGRYYFVDEIESVSIGLWDLHLSVDVLMTYKTPLLECYGFIDRNEFTYNMLVVDNQVPLIQGETVSTEYISNQVFVEDGVGQYLVTGILLEPTNENT